MKPRLAVSASLALAAHVALVLGLALPAPPRGSGLPARAVQVVALRAAATERQEMATDAAAAVATPEAAVPDAPPVAGRPLDDDEPESSAAPAPDRFAPSLAPESAAIPMPDATMPPDGIELRAYLQLDAQGQPAATAFAAPPGAPAAFAKMADLGLRQGRIQAPQGAVGQVGLAYCLRVRFRPDANEPELAWLPGMADSSKRCLQGSPKQVQPMLP